MEIKLLSFPGVCLVCSAAAAAFYLRCPLCGVVIDEFATVYGGGGYDIDSGGTYDSMRSLSSSLTPCSQHGPHVNSSALAKGDSLR